MCVSLIQERLSVVIMYFSDVTMRSCPYEAEGMWITCSIPLIC